jgi:predicted TIM-barrel fold metal-dependent hydrolase
MFDARSHGLIDCHTHVWTADSSMEPSRHYTPEGDRPVQKLLADMAAHAIARAVLVQPSFLADDNQCLIQSLSHHSSELRGVATFMHAPTASHVRDLHAAGVRGFRLNLFASPILPDPHTRQWAEALDAMRDAGWHIVIAGSGPTLALAVERLASAQLPLVIDHFAMPSATEVARCPGVRAIADAAAHLPCWIKLSAPYRLNGPTAFETVAAFNSLGFVDRYIWGSDSPFTRFERKQDYPMAISALERLISRDLVSADALRRNASTLYFAT